MRVGVLLFSLGVICSALLLAITVLLFRPVQPGRELLVANRVYYVRSDGDDVSECRTDSPASACRTWQHAIDLVTRLDFGGHAVTVQHGDEGRPVTFTEPVLIPALSGGGSLFIRGRPAPGDTVFSTGASQVFWLDGTVSRVRFSDLTLEGGGSGLIQVVWDSHAVIQSGVVFGPATFAHVYVHDSQAVASLLQASYTIDGDAPYHLFVNGGMVYHEHSTVTLTGERHFAGAFAAAVNGGRIQAIASTFTGTAIGQRSSVTSGGIVNTFGAGEDYFPGTR